MSSASAFAAIRALLDAAWAGRTPLAWDNENFTKPEPPAPFLVVQVTGDDYDQMSMGGGTRLENRWQEEGELLLGVVVPQGEGSLRARQLAEAAADIFRGLSLDAVPMEFRDISIGLGVPAEDQGPWWLLPVRIRWLRG